MKILFLKISFLLLIIAVLSGCRTRSFSYTKDKILTNFTNFETFLNNEKISLDTIYLDKDNIESIEINKQGKTIHIIQKNKNVEYFSPQNIRTPDVAQIKVSHFYLYFNLIST